jgi:hypothetical protein
VALALWLQRRRDIGGALMARRDRGTSEYVFTPSRLIGRTLWGSWFAEQWLGLTFWAAGLAVFSAIEAAVVPVIIRLLATGGGPLGRLAGGAGLGPPQYLSSFISIDALLVGGFAVTEVARWVADARQHRTDVLLAMPVSARRLLVARMVAVIACVAVLGVSVAAGLQIGGVVGGYAISWLGVLRTALMIALLGWALGGVGLVVVTVLRSGAATAIVGAVLAVSLLLPAVVGLITAPSWLAWPSLLDAFATPYEALPAAGRLIYLGLLGVAGLVLAEIAMRRGARVAD